MAASQILSETTIALARAAEVCPLTPSGHRLHRATLFRWANKGRRLSNGETITLATARLGHFVITSHEAIARFFDAISERPNASPMSSIRTSGQRQRATATATKKLQAAGA